MIIAQNINKNFKVKTNRGIFQRSNISEVTVVNNVSLKIEPGKIVGLLGINGAGKTTTIKMLSGMLQPTSGNIFMDDIDVVKNHKLIKKYINVITGGERNIYWRLTAKENLEYFGALYGLKKQELKNRIDYVLNLVGLTEVKDQEVEKYSKGMKQRLQIARGLINNPKYIFLDEPTLGLDINIAKEMRNYIRGLAQNEKKGILLTTHYMFEAEELCDYIYVIDKGKIIMEGTPKELKEKVKSNTEIIITTEDNIDNIKAGIISFIDNNGEKLEFISEDSVNKIKYISNKHDIVGLLNFITRYNISISDIKIKETNLEDIILEIISGGNNIDEFHKSS